MQVESYVKFYSNLNVNFLKIEQNSLSTNLQEAYRRRKVFNANSLLYNNFSEMLDALYFLPHSAFSTNFCSIYRREYSQPYYNYVCTLNGEITFKDYNIHNNDDYEYLAVIGIGQSGGSYIYQVYDNRDDYDEKILTHVNWDSWSICNIEETENAPDTKIYMKTGDTWLLGLNLEGENLMQNMSANSWDTLGRYPRIAIGQKNYESSTFTGLLGRMQKVVSFNLKNSYKNGKCENTEEIEDKYRYTERINISSRYGREVEKYQAWKQFCNDGELKLLKDVKGNAWIVQIVDNPSNNIANHISSMPTTISFNWKEVLDTENISIIGKDKELEQTRLT